MPQFTSENNDLFLSLFPWKNIYDQYTHARGSQDASVGIAMDCGLDGQGRQGTALGSSKEFFPLHHSVQTGPGAHPASYLIGTGGSSPGG
jgi:hypothetical protein